MCIRFIPFLPLSLVLTACGGGGGGGEDTGPSFLDIAAQMDAGLATVDGIAVTPAANLPVSDVVDYVGNAAFGTPGVDIASFAEADMVGSMSMRLFFDTDSSVGLIDDLQLPDGQDVEGALNMLGVINDDGAAALVGGQLTYPDGTTYDHSGMFDGIFYGASANYIAGDFEIDRSLGGTAVTGIVGYGFLERE